MVLAVVAQQGDGWVDQLPIKVDEGVPHDGVVVWTWFVGDIIVLFVWEGERTGSWLEELSVLHSCALVWEGCLEAGAGVGGLAVLELLADPFDGESEYGGVASFCGEPEIWMFFGLKLFYQIVDGVANHFA